MTHQNWIKEILWRLIKKKENLWGCSSRHAGTTPSPQLSIVLGIGSNTYKNIFSKTNRWYFHLPASSLQKLPETGFGSSLSRNAH